MLCELGRPAEAATHLDEAFELLDDSSDRPSLAEWHLLAVRVSLAAGDIERARASFAACAELALEIADVELAATIDGWRGMLAAAEARAAGPDERLKLFDEACEALDRCIASLEPLGHHELERWRARRSDVERERASPAPEPTSPLHEPNDDRTR